MKLDQDPEIVEIGDQDIPLFILNICSENRRFEALYRRFRPQTGPHREQQLPEADSLLQLP